MCGLALQNYRPIVNGERYLTDQETADILRVTRRTLNDYRADGIIPYVQIGGKVLTNSFSINSSILPSLA